MLYSILNLALNAMLYLKSTGWKRPVHPGGMTFLPPAGNHGLVEAQGRRCLAVGEALFFDHFLDKTKDLEHLASAEGNALAASGIDLFKSTGVTEADLVVYMDFHVFDWVSS